MANVSVVHENYFGSDRGENSSSSDEMKEEQAQQLQAGEKSGMAGVIARILSKDISKSSRVLLSKGKTAKQILRDITERKRMREQSEDEKVTQKRQKLTGKEKICHEMDKEERKKAWETMGRKIPTVLDNPKEVKLKKTATHGMVQLFQLVSSAKMQN